MHVVHVRLLRYVTLHCNFDFIGQVKPTLCCIALEGRGGWEGHLLRILPALAGGQCYGDIGFTDLQFSNAVTLLFFPS